MIVEKAVEYTEVVSFSEHRGSGLMREEMSTSFIEFGVFNRAQKLRLDRIGIYKIRTLTIRLGE